MPPDLELLSRALVASGRFRVEDGYNVNFVRFSHLQSGINLMFSERELTDKTLLSSTRHILTQVYQGQIHSRSIKQKITNEIKRLIEELKKQHKVDADMELRFARVMVQSAHPAVILLALAENIEIFVSTAYDISGMLDVQTWQTSGENSGMQSTDGRDAAVFVSCGGHPFYPEDEEQQDPTHGNGKPALARMMVIAGQEFGHYADIIRDRAGRHISRYSTNFSSTRAKKTVREGRLQDIQQIEQVRSVLKRWKFDQAVETDKTLKFFHEHNIKTIRSSWYRWKSFRLKNQLARKCKKTSLYPLCQRAKKEPYPAYTLLMMLEDMRFNLSPKADVYARDNKQEEEAIACVEALARVPQQVNKWGHACTRLLMPHLYQVYYTDVIPGCINAYETLTGQRFTINTTPPGWSAGRIYKKLLKQVKSIKKSSFGKK